MTALKTNSNSSKSNSNLENSNLGASSSSANQCCICLDDAKQAVVTLCGHLFCKPCINQWIDLKPLNQQTCPVCNKGINKQKIVRLYGMNDEIATSSIEQNNLVSGDPSGVSLPYSSGQIENVDNNELFEIQAEYIAQEARNQSDLTIFNNNRFIGLKNIFTKISKVFDGIFLLVSVRIAIFLNLIFPWPHTLLQAPQGNNVRIIMNFFILFIKLNNLIELWKFITF